MTGKTMGSAEWPAVALLATVILIGAACSGNTRDGGKGSPAQPPTAGMPTLQSVGEGEGELDLIAWQGYVDDPWTRPFERETGCEVKPRYAGSSDEMVTLMADGGGGHYDLVSAPGEASVRLIYDGDVRPVNVNLIPDWKNFIPQLQSPSHNTVDGVHYGISLQWGPNTLMYNTEEFPTAPDSWSVIYNPAYKGQITVPNDPLQIADAALYLKATKPELGITDVYELTRPQLDAAVALLKEQKPLIRKYWTQAYEEISMFMNGDAIVGSSSPYQESVLRSNDVPIASTIPKEGATGWADSWMLATDAPHPNCAYLWMKYISTPKAQALQAFWYGETPANTKACPIMDQLDKGSCALYHANAPASYFDSISFQKTPLADCGNGKTDCMPYSEWKLAWTTEVTG
ncbi:MAG TPA: ABC transporter substrate-binding protein [Actinomycetota bacterium]